MGRPRKADAGDTREKILQVALELFAEKSFHGTSMRDLATAVGVRESALYHYFSSKDAILRALMERHGPARAQTLTRLNFEFVDELGAKAFLTQTALNMFESWYTPTEEKFARVMFAEGTRHAFGGAVQPHRAIEKALEVLEGFFAQLVERKMLRKADPRVLAVGFMGPLLMMRMRSQILAPKPVPLSKLRPQLIAQVEQFLTGAAPRKGAD